MPFDCDVELDLDEAFDQADDELRRLPAIAVRRAADEGLAESKARRRYKDRSGGLTGRAYARMLTATGMTADSEIGWPVPYASYVDEGTASHPIRPRLGSSFIGPPAPGQRRSRGLGGTLLTFQVGGRFVSKRQVQHPGTRAYAFAGDAALKAERVLVREAEVTCARIAELFER